MWWREVFLEKELDSVSGWLQQADWAYARGAPAVLHMADDLTFQPNGISDRRKQHKNRQRDLDQRHDDEGEYGQFSA